MVSAHFDLRGIKSSIDKGLISHELLDMEKTPYETTCSNKN
jgi:hypothetical protein